MANVTIITDKVYGQLVDMMHKCGELLQVEWQSTHVIAYRSMYGSKITQCPHCMQDIEWEDLFDL